jgi:hypothetical protein
MRSTPRQDVDTPAQRLAEQVARVAVAALAISLAAIVISGVPLVWRYVPAVVDTTWDRRVHRLSASTALWAALVWGLASAARSVARRRNGRQRRDVAAASMTVLGVILVVLASVTGYLLPWDQLALWAVTVGSDIRGIDDAAFSDGVRFVLIGGTEISPGAYRIWTIVHTVLVPLAIAATFALRWRLRSRGASGDVS